MDLVKNENISQQVPLLCKTIKSTWFKKKNPSCTSHSEAASHFEDDSKSPNNDHRLVF